MVNPLAPWLEVTPETQAELDRIAADFAHRERLHAFSMAHEIAPDERVTTQEERDEAREREIAEHGGVYNGCTDAGLHKMFPGRVRHIMGFNWVVREEGTLFA